MEPANLLRIQTLHDGWSDKDNIMLHACFQLLVDCVEQENLLNGHIDWNHSKEHQNAKTELTRLYDWWKQRVAAEANDEFNWIRSKDRYQQDTEMLMALVKMRKYLWT